MQKAKTIMIQGTASAVGKSLIAAALCRIFKQDGYNVAPFKAQNMALNSFVTEEGGEMGRAQAVQAEAAGITPTVDMNPVLLKPAAGGCQVIVMGKVFKTVTAYDYYLYTPSLLDTVAGALERMRREYDIVVIEGAGSPAEINLKDQEIVNMRTAKMAGAPVLLVGDIDRGGVFASLLGTLELLDEDERRYVKGLIINKFRGDVKQIQSANEYLEKRTGKSVLGVVPYTHDIRIAQEDSVYLDDRKNEPATGNLEIAVVRLPHISNFDDFDPLTEEAGISVTYVTQRFELSNPHLIILPGTKSTVADIEYLRHSGLATAILTRARAGTPVLGICGGYQMLGQKILDPQKVESDRTEVVGLGLLNAVTEYTDEKSTRQVRARVTADTGLLAGMKGVEVGGYEIHMGQTPGREENSVLKIVETPRGDVDYFDGTRDPDGTVLGTYLHGLFYNDEFREAFLNNLRRHWGMVENAEGAALAKGPEYDKLAALVRSNLNIPGIYRIIEESV
jgi:adenosylcobyric acid synthase